MYDLLRISVPQPEEVFLKWLGNCDIESTATRTRKGAIEHSARLKNLSLKSRSGWLNISGSISRFTQDHNITPIPFGGVKQAIEHLSRQLQWDINGGRVTSYELANTFSMNYNVGNYLNMMVLWKKQEPQFYGNGENKTVLFGSSTQEVFYDKTLQMVAKNHPIPQEFQNKNLLRYEHRRKRGLERRKGGINTPLYVSELYSEKRVTEALKEYVKSYGLVQKVKRKNGVNISELDSKVRLFSKEYLNT